VAGFFGELGAQSARLEYENDEVALAA